MSSAACGIQLTADCEPLRLDARLVVVLVGCLEEAADRFAGDAEADDTARRIDLGDRVRRDEAPLAREEPALHGKRVRHVRKRPVHGALDLADEAAAVVSDEEAGGAGEIQRKS